MKEPQAEKKRRVQRLAQVGATPEDIATELQIPIGRLQKRYHRELDRGRVLGKHGILEKIYDNAASGANLTATSFWIKAQCGWRDTGSSSASGNAVQATLRVKLHTDNVDVPQC